MVPPRKTEPERSPKRFRDHSIPYRPAEMLLRMHRRFGSVVNLASGRAGYAYLLGPEANRFVFAHSELFRWHDAFDWLIPVDGATSMLLSDGAEHRQRRKLVQPAMHRRQIATHLDTMIEHVDAAIADWRPGEHIDVYQRLREAVRRTTLHSLFGERLAAHARLFGDQLQVLLDLCGGLPQAVTWKQRLRTPEWRRALTAREQVDDRIYQEIARVREHNDPAHHDVLTSLVHGRDEEGDGLSDVEIRDQVVTLIVAGYETTSAVLAWAIYSMLSTPGVWDRARAEVSDVLGARPPTSADLDQLGYLNGVVRETLRLYPSVTVIGRRADQDFEFAGRRIRRGNMVITSPYVTHRLPEIWPEPTRFRPLRWDPNAAEYQRPAPHEFLPFGGGPHRCVGATMATTELIVMLARLLATSSLTLLDQRLTGASMISMRPRRGLRTAVRSVSPV